MKAVSPPASDLVFSWDISRFHHRYLAIFLVVSLLLHALWFAIFGLRKVPFDNVAPRPAKLSFILEKAANAPSLKNWLADEDPALTLNPVPPPGVSSQIPSAPTFRPSYAERVPALRPYPTPSDQGNVISAHPPGPVPVARPSASAAPVDPIPTKVVIHDPGQQLGKFVVPKLQGVTAKRDTPATARFLLGISGDGVVRYCFLRESSDDATLDARARNVLLQGRFPDLQRSLTGAGVIWREATINWGTDIFAPLSSSSRELP